MSEPEPTHPRPARLFAILARAAPVGVILRRGPSKQVRLIKWQLGSDRLEEGQWLKGRVYERRCDLSPSGELLIYFAAKHTGPLGTWTAISKPPYFTALALWPKGDAWGGGGLFDSELNIALNHKPENLELGDGFRLKKNMRVRPYGHYPGRGEDFPIYHSLLVRGGWSLLDEGDPGSYRSKGRLAWEYARPMIYERKTKAGHTLRMLFRGIGQRDGAWYWTDYCLLDDSGRTLADLPHTDWADFDDGDLVFAKDGCLFRLERKNFSRYASVGADALKLIGDLTAQRFEAVAAPSTARAW